MSAGDDIKQPQDRLPPADEREDGTDVDEPDYPDSDAPPAGSSVSPETEAVPEKPLRHGVDKLRPSGR